MRRTLVGFPPLLPRPTFLFHLPQNTEVWQVVNITTRWYQKAVFAADANRRFSELLRLVKKGRSVIVTSHGKPVAKITPVAEDATATETARSALFVRLRAERPVNAGRWRRDELYD